MANVVVCEEPSDEEARVLEWRAETLERAGYDQVWANVLAASSGVDLHRAVELGQSGCPPELAARILL